MSINNQTTVRTAQAPTAGTGTTNAVTSYNPGQPGNIPNTTGTKTSRYFNNYFVGSTGAVSIGANDAIVSYFETQTGNRESAAVLSRAVIETALQQNLDPMAVLDDFKKLPTGELDAYLALFLNLSRVNTSLLGISNMPRASKYVSRTILP